MASDEAVVLALVEAVDRVRGISRARLADLLVWAGSPGKVLDGGDLDYPDLTSEQLGALRAAFDPAAADGWEAQLVELRQRDPDVRVCTVTSPGYPVNLRDVYNRPPFLFTRGRLDATDDRSVAVVGTRSASDEGLSLGRRLAAELAAAAVTVVSGLALGIDNAAHVGALDAGGRTIAVLGHGIARPAYPAANRPLAARIVASGQGAVVSHFTPDAPPTRQTFPMRNVVTSALSLGTVVIEAGPTSGAKQQAERCLEHGKQLFLVEHLVMTQEWVKQVAARPGAVVVRGVDDILARVDALLTEATDSLIG